MNSYRSGNYSYSPYVHSWPGKPKVKDTGKHSAARKARAVGRNA